MKFQRLSFEPWGSGQTAPGEPLQGMGSRMEIHPKYFASWEQDTVLARSFNGGRIGAFLQHLKNYFFIIKVFTFIVVNLDNAGKQRE